MSRRLGVGVPAATPTRNRPQTLLHGNGVCATYASLEIASQNTGSNAHVIPSMSLSIERAGVACTSGVTTSLFRCTPTPFAAPGSKSKKHSRVPMHHLHGTDVWRQQCRTATLRRIRRSALGRSAKPRPGRARKRPRRRRTQRLPCAHQRSG